MLVKQPLLRVARKVVHPYGKPAITLHLHCRNFDFDIGLEDSSGLEVGVKLQELKLMASG